MLRRDGCPAAVLSAYLFDRGDTKADHYYLLPRPTGFEAVSLANDSVEGQAHSTSTSISTHIEDRPCLVEPTPRGVIKVLGEEGTSFDATALDALSHLAPHFEALCVRFQDLCRLEILQTQNAQVDDAMLALYDNSFDLSGATQFEVARKVIDLVCSRMDLDRAGVFLRDGDLLRGAWGMDDVGEVVSITSTVFEVFPPNEDRLTEAARIARGDLPFFLTQDLDGEGRESIEGDIGASATVPMRIGDRIVGVLAVDTYYSRRPIRVEQLAPLRILANQAAVAIENARLYQQLEEAREDLETRILERTAELAQANDDKDVLLQEVYHRTKNNLQLVISLLNLQSNQIVDEQAHTALQDCASRVQSMAMIHEELYAGGDLRAIDFGQQIHKLVSILFKSYGVAPGSIKLHLDADYLHLALDTAIPLSLIVNELVTNSLKYAFGAQRVGSLHIRLQISEEDVELEISDDGVGLPKDLDFATAPTLGLQLVADLVGQLRGQLEIEGRGGMGTGYRIRLPGLAKGTGR
jgi:two-component sensor histidine kinase